MNYRYNSMKPLWELVRDCYIGTTAVKESRRSREYLPVSTREKREIEHEMNLSTTQYEIRKKYAVYDNIFRPTIDDMVGLMQKNPLRLSFGVTDDSESPKEIRDLDVYGNIHNDGLKGLKGRLNFHQVLYGRYGLLLDVVTGPSRTLPRFTITEYQADRILDGENGKCQPDGENALQWALIDETLLRFDQNMKSWDRVVQFRVLGLDENREYYQAVLSGPNVMEQWLNFDLKHPGPRAVYPMWKQKRLNFIPFTVCNVNTIGFDDWQEPPFLDVAHIALGLYQTDSLYKKALWNFASPTLSIANAERTEQDLFLGDAIWPRTNGAYPVSVSLLETDGNGLAEMRHAKEEMKQSLRYTSIRDLLEGSGANASGQAIELRTISGTATVAAIDQAGARAIEEQLIYATLWTGAGAEEAGRRISCRADTTYVTSQFTLSTIASFIESNATADAGRPLLSQRNIYSMLEKALPDTLTSFEDNESAKK